jgi:14-3-3 protein epsilon
MATATKATTGAAPSKTDTVLETEFGSKTADDLLQLVRISEMSERYEDMCFFVKKLVQVKAAAKVDLTVEERNLLSVAFKNVVGTKRASWRTLSPESEDEIGAELLAEYRKVVEKELDAKCHEIISILTDYLIPQVRGRNDETEVFYLKMAGDYFRYLCEFNSAQENIDAAHKNYKDAWAVAQVHLTEVHPTRLGLALNYSVCQYEILKNSDEACALAKKAFDEAIDKLDNIEDASYKDATLIMQLLRDNLTLWTSETREDE